ncbi:hypothetical protein DPEC_G00047040 [Dallia pectoralis]|uniref:Uncharacterized protein n=1 Tax=Dallia pectoralis TaxID=75939 RepID=A0ACC2HA11_DALPE|nr:hypothetical protein DPEC_G00047040 [Dallia pectoralis]
METTFREGLEERLEERLWRHSMFTPGHRVSTEVSSQRKVTDPPWNDPLLLISAAFQETGDSPSRAPARPQARTEPRDGGSLCSLVAPRSIISHLLFSLFFCSSGHGAFCSVCDHRTGADRVAPRHTPHVGPASRPECAGCSLEQPGRWSEARASEPP